jgi:hypothetical protein
MECIAGFTENFTFSIFLANSQPVLVEHHMDKLEKKNGRNRISECLICLEEKMSKKSLLSFFSFDLMALFVIICDGRYIHNAVFF